MAEDRTDGGDPTADVPVVSGELAALSPLQQGTSLVANLVGVVDAARQIATDLGVRSQRVFMVHGAWTGGARGAGVLQVTSRREVVPVPRVRPVDSVRREAQALGVTEVGDVTVDQISARYTEDDLMGRTPDLQDPEQPRTSRGEVQFWWEVEDNSPSVPKPVIRRFSGPVSVPVLIKGSLEWRVTLRRQAVDRARDGGTTPRGAF